MSKNDVKVEKEKKTKKNRSGLIWMISTASFAVLLLLVCQFFLVDGVDNQKTFMPNTTINGIDVSGLNETQAQNVVAYNLLNTRDEVSLNLNYKGKNWQFVGSDFEIANDIEKEINDAINYGQSGNFFTKKKIANEVKKNGLNLTISYKNVLGGIDQKLEEVITEVEQEYAPYQVIFTPESENMFSIQAPKPQIVVDRQKLFEQIDNELAVNKTANIEIPVIETPIEINEEELLSKIGLRAKFSTNYTKSSKNRKSNIKKALSSFNGKIVMPGDRISFNETTGPRNEENGYKKANIILNGAYVEGTGGGVCQASTTLYNALLLAGIDVLEVSNHSLPASCVPLSLDAMVSEGSSDMIFENNTQSPIYIKCYGTDDDVIVEIYGDKFDEGMTLKTRAELVKIIPHNGDTIIPDSNGDYEDYVVYKGEYHRIKYPREGYESKAYLQILQGEEVIDEREIRHDYYWPQDGIIVEGTEEVTEGIILPQNNVKFIPPQQVSDEQTSTVRARLEKDNPAAFNP